jgi:phosphoribosyl 1,2-cyclic phosphodiesterase
MGLKVKFWGVRGSIACASSDHMVYGGNTSCVEVNAGGAVAIFDAGTGIRGLGKDLLRRGVTSATVLLSHTHWDHINGFPFFAPAFSPGFALDVLAGHLVGREGGIRSVFATQMDTPTFPVPLEALRGSIRFDDFAAGESFALNDQVTVRTAALRHPNGSTGYRIDYGGQSVCYVTDTEHLPGQPDQNVLDLIAGADLVIYDSTYTDDEFPTKVGWGHSTWQEGIRLCRAANVRRIAIFHHDPEHDDTFMTALEDDARCDWPEGALVAREGMVLTLR